MRVWSFLVLSVALQLAHSDELWHEEGEILAPQDYAGHSFVQMKRSTGPLDTLRLTFYTAHAESTIADPAQLTYMQSILQRAEQVVESMVSLYRINSSIRVSRSCSELWAEGENTGRCKAVEENNRCGLMQNLPSEHLARLTVYEEDGTVNELEAGDGVASTDLLVYITGYSICTVAGPRADLASGNVCQRDQFDRPVVGYINICPAKIVSSLGANPVQEAQDVAIVVHELVNILSMSMRSIPLWYDGNGVPRTQRCPDHPECASTDRAGRPPLVESSYLIDEGTLSGGMLVTPSVQKVAREHFGCAELAGAALQESGGTVLARWAEAALMPEVMSSGSWPGLPKVVSGFTMALLQDSGWYLVNTTAAGDLAWGRGAGCDFAAGVCGAVSQGCGEEAVERRCAFHREGKGQCTAAGWDSSCPIADPGDLESCAAAPADPGACDGEDCQGQAFGAAAACFEADLLREGFDGAEVQPVGCYEYRCREELEVRLPDGAWRECTSDAASWQADGFSGRLQCPNPADLCGKPVVPTLQPPYKLAGGPEEEEEEETLDLPRSFFDEISTRGWLTISFASVIATIVIYTLVAWWRWRVQATTPQLEALLKRVSGKPSRRRRRYLPNDRINLVPCSRGSAAGSGEGPDVEGEQEWMEQEQAKALAAEAEMLKMQEEAMNNLRGAPQGGGGLAAGSGEEAGGMPGLLARSSRSNLGDSGAGVLGEGAAQEGGVGGDLLSVGGSAEAAKELGAAKGSTVEFFDPATGQKRRGSLVKIQTGPEPAALPVRKATVVTTSAEPGKAGVPKNGAEGRRRRMSVTEIGQHINVKDEKTGQTRRKSVVSVEAVEGSHRRGSMASAAGSVAGSAEGGAPQPGTEIVVTDPRTGKQRRGSVVSMTPVAAAGAGKRASISSQEGGRGRRGSVARGRRTSMVGSSQEEEGGSPGVAARRRRMSVEMDEHLKHYGEHLHMPEKHIGFGSVIKHLHHAHEKNHHHHHHQPNRAGRRGSVEGAAGGERRSSTASGEGLPVGKVADIKSVLGAAFGHSAGPRRSSGSTAGEGISREAAANRSTPTTSPLSSARVPGGTH